VNGVITNLLIDTGATVTLISTGFIKDMSNMPTLSPSQRDSEWGINLSFTFQFTTISLCGGITTVSETVTL
jgi:hypothetical protein